MISQPVALQQEFDHRFEKNCSDKINAINPGRKSGDAATL